MKCHWGLGLTQGRGGGGLGGGGRGRGEERGGGWRGKAGLGETTGKYFEKPRINPADLLFVFGTREDVARRVDEAVRLWREGFFRWSIVSGGVTPGSKLSECEIIRAAMVARGIPPERILGEDRSTNTGENVIFSLPIIDAALGLKNIRSVICLGNTWTARRYPMTLHRHWPGGREDADHSR